MVTPWPLQRVSSGIITAISIRQAKARHNSTGGRHSYIRHGNGDNYCWADGHVALTSWRNLDQRQCTVSPTGITCRRQTRYRISPRTTVAPGAATTFILRSPRKKQRNQAALKLYREQAHTLRFETVATKP